MKVLALCHAGVVRSGAMVRALKEEGIDAIAAGVGHNGKEALNTLMNWADRIVVMDEKLLPQIPRHQLKKTTLADVGGDVWGYADHPDLKNRVFVMVEEWKKSGWKFRPLRLKPTGPVERLEA